MVRYRVISLSPSRGSTRNHSTRGKKSPKDHILKLPKTNIVVIKAGNVQFRVNSDILSQLSPIFRDASRKISPTLPKNRIPAFEVEESAADMRIFFNMLFLKAYTPQSADEIVIALGLSERYRLSTPNPIQARIFQFLHDTYPTNLHKLDRLQSIDPHLRGFYWLRSEACFCLANTLYHLRQSQGHAEIISILLFTILLCCARCPLHDINKGVLDSGHKRLSRLHDTLRSYIVGFIRPKLDELACNTTYAFLWQDIKAPECTDEHRGCTKCAKMGTGNVCEEHQDCELYREMLKDEVLIYLDREKGYDHALWHFPNLVGGKPIHGLNCCKSCRTNWIYCVMNGRSSAVEELKGMYADAWKLDM